MARRRTGLSESRAQGHVGTRATRPSRCERAGRRAASGARATASPPPRWRGDGAARATSRIAPQSSSIAPLPADDGSDADVARTRSRTIPSSAALRRSSATGAPPGAAGSPVLTISRRSLPHDVRALSPGGGGHDRRNPAMPYCQGSGSPSEPTDHAMSHAARTARRRAVPQESHVRAEIAAHVSRGLQGVFLIQPPPTSSRCTSACAGDDGHRPTK